MNNFTQFFNKKNIPTILGTLFSLIVIARILVWFNGPTLPYCSDSKIMKEEIPRIVVRQLGQVGYYISTSQLQVSQPEETDYDKDAGVRMCVATLTLREDNDVETETISYQLAFLDKDKKQIQIKVHVGD